MDMTEAWWEVLSRFDSIESVEDLGWLGNERESVDPDPSRWDMEEREDEYLSSLARSDAAELRWYFAFGKESAPSLRAATTIHGGIMFSGVFLERS